MSKKPLIGVLFALVLVFSLAASPQEDAKAEAARKDFAAELIIVRPLALKAEAWAQRTLGFMYSKGNGVPQDYAEAVHARDRW